MQDIAVSLGLGKSRIIYSLYKMLLYMEGDFFLPHRDTEKEEKMFATLVVVLPSAHSGGDLIIKHDGKTEKYSFSAKKNLYQTGYAAFYADCEHEVKKVTEGARICLIYNLKKGTSKVQPKAFKVSETAEYAAKILKKEKTKTMKSLILLKHQYTEKNFSRDSLKNSDILKAQVLFEAAEKADYSAHLALVTMQKTYDLLSRYDDYYYDDKDEDNDNKPEIGDLIDSSLSVNQWFDSKGKSVPFGDMKLKESEIFSSEPFGKGEADEMDKED